MDSLQLFEKIQQLRIAKGIASNYELCKRAGISQSTLYCWKIRSTIPTLPILEAFSDVLNVPISQLLSEEPVEGLSEQKKHLLFLWDLMSSEQRQGFLQAMESSVKTEKSGIKNL